MYSRTSFFVASMISTGACLSVFVKLFYQLGYDQPLLVTLLLLFGQSFSTVVYFTKLALGKFKNSTTHNKVFSCSRQLKNQGKNNLECNEFPSLSTLSSFSEASIPQQQCKDSEEAITDLEASIIQDDEIKNTFESPIYKTELSYSSVLTRQQQQCKAILCDETPHNIYASTEKKLKQKESSESLSRKDSEEAATDLEASIIQDNEIKDTFESSICKTDLLCSSVPTRQQQPWCKAILCDETPYISTEKKLKQKTSFESISSSTKCKRRGSLTGLSEKSIDAIAWVHSIPWYLKPVIPAFFNILSNIMRWTALLYVTASVAEMIKNGISLVVSAIVSRLIRKRMISLTRWAGVAIVITGLILVGTAEFLCGINTKSSTNQQIISFALILAQCFMTTFRDMAEEVLTQETGSSATMLFGAQGCIGFIIFLIAYLTLAPFLGEFPSQTMNQLFNDPLFALFSISITSLGFLSGLTSSLVIVETSLLTKNIWRNLKSALVWIFGIITFYFSGNGIIGEKWVAPDSFFILGGFITMVVGISVYYRETPAKTLN